MIFKIAMIAIAMIFKMVDRRRALRTGCSLSVMMMFKTVMTAIVIILKIVKILVVLATLVAVPLVVVIAAKAAVQTVVAVLVMKITFLLLRVVKRMNKHQHLVRVVIMKYILKV